MRNDPPARPSKWRRYSIRSLLVAIALIAIASYFIGKSYRERVAFSRSLGRLNTVGDNIDVDYFDRYDGTFQPGGLSLQGPVVIIGSFSISDTQVAEMADRLREFAKANPHVNVVLQFDSHKLSDDACGR